MTKIGEPLENPDTIVFPIKDPMPQEKPIAPQEPAPVKKEPVKVPA